MGIQTFYRDWGEVGGVRKSQLRDKAFPRDAEGEAAPHRWRPWVLSCPSFPSCPLSSRPEEADGRAPGAGGAAALGGHPARWLPPRPRARGDAATAQPRQAGHRAGLTFQRGWGQPKGAKAALTHLGVGRSPRDASREKLQIHPHPFHIPQSCLIPHIWAKFPTDSQAGGTGNAPGCCTCWEFPGDPKPPEEDPEPVLGEVTALLGKVGRAGTELGSGCFADPILVRISQIQARAAPLSLWQAS